jgi:signal transduction histidine kinase
LFLLTVAVGSLVQALVAVAVLKPLENRDAVSRAELVAANVALEIAALREPTRAELDTLLAGHRRRMGLRGAWIGFRSSDSTWVSEPRRIVLVIATQEGGTVVREDTLGDADRRGELGARPPGDRPPPRLEVLARHAVHGMAPTSAHGEVVVGRFAPPGGSGFPFGSRTALLILPVALLASAAAGLVVVRLLVRRLRKIEVLAARVAEGDLSVRIADTSGDEIGRLAERLDRMTERLAEARDEIEANDRQRRALFADITHELATPLTSIRGYAETMLDPKVPLSPDDRARSLEGVLEESQRLDRLIRDLFDLARLEAGATAFSPEALDWVALCRNTLDRFVARFQAKGIALAWRGSPAEAWVVADGHRLVQVLENLLSNALRYVPRGGRVEVGLEPVAGRDPAFRLTVADDGPGVPAAELSRVFDRFYRAGEPSNEGSGLGLAIVRAIAERHGGRASAEARQPRGLEIAVTLPSRTVPGSPAAASA